MEVFLLPLSIFAAGIQYGSRGSVRGRYARWIAFHSVGGLVFPARRYVQHSVETMLSKKMPRGEILPGQTVTVDVLGEALVLQ